MKRSIRALHRFFNKNKAKDLIVPTSTTDICLKIICPPYLNDVKCNCNPFNWDPNCTKGTCQNCVGSKWFDDLKYNTALKELHEKITSYLKWIKEKDGKKSKQIL